MTNDANQRTKTIAVIGGTGQVGRAVLKSLAETKNKVVSISRNVPQPGERTDGVVHYSVDVSNGHGLAEALKNTDVIIDVTDGKTKRASQSALIQGSRNIAKAATKNGVNKIVLLSIVGIDKSEWYYYRAKLAQERTYEQDNRVNVVIQRATQFHSFLDATHNAIGGIGVIPYIKNAEFQSIDVDIVAQRLVQLAINEDEGRMQDIAGPTVQKAKELADQWKRRAGKSGLLLGLPLPGPSGKVFKRGYNIPLNPQCLGGGYSDHLNMTLSS